MHFQHTEADGTPMPGVNDVIEIFAGKKWVSREEAAANRPKSKFETLVTGSRESWGGNTSMAPAFFEKDPQGVFKKQAGAARGNDTQMAALVAEREGEQKIVALWSMLPDAERKKTYEADNFVPKADAPTAITAEFKTADGVKVKTIIDKRCAECHQPGGSKSEFPLDNYLCLAKYLDAPPAVEIPDGAAGAWCASTRQIGREKLAQSTHAHLLSFAMLFALTGLVFSFTSYPGFVRFIVAPIVLIAQVADVSCWWLARIDGPGIYFAQAIMATGAVVGLGLGAQIVLSVFNLYGIKGKVVLAALFIGAAAGGGFVAEKYAKPHLAEQKAKKEKEAADAEAAKKKPDAPKPAPTMPPMMNPSLEKVLVAADWEKAPWGPSKETNRVPDGGMLRAFFDKSGGDFKDAMKAKKDDPEAFKAIVAERTGEMNVVLAWAKAKPEDRKKAFEKDEFAIPSELKGKPLTAEFLANDKAVKIKSIMEARCYSCHSSSDKLPLDGYEKLEKFLK
jgi:uncharacterized membrane protein